MTTIERLRVLAKAVKWTPARAISGEWDEEGDAVYLIGFRGQKMVGVEEGKCIASAVNAMPDITAVVDIGDELATAVREWSLELNNTTINDCAVLAIRYQQALARLEAEA